MNVLELPVDAGEADVGHLVQLAKLLHGQLADRSALDLGLEIRRDVILHLRDQAFDLGVANGPLPTGLLQALLELLPVEGHAGAVLLDHLDRRPLDILVGGEPPLTPVALATPADGQPIVARPRVDHPVVVHVTIGALHRRFRSSAITISRSRRPAQPQPIVARRGSRWKSAEETRRSGMRRKGEEEIGRRGDVPVSSSPFLLISSSPLLPSSVSSRPPSAYGTFFHHCVVSWEMQRRRQEGSER